MEDLLFFETEGELNAFVMDYFLEYRNVEFDEINKPMVFSVADIAQDIVHFLKTKDLVFVAEDYDECEGCTGCNELPVEKEEQVVEAVETPTPEPKVYVEPEVCCEPTTND
jgi:hypothetical protein